MTELSQILTKHPDFKNYLNEKQREAFMDDDDGFIADLDEWKSATILTLEKTKKQLQEILDSELMKQASRFAPWVKERWLGQLSIILELLGQIEEA